MRYANEMMKTYGVVSKGNGEAWLIEEHHTSLSTGGGEAGQGYPCILICENDSDRETFLRSEDIRG